MDDPVVYLSVSDVSRLLGIPTSSVSVYRLPTPDALIGRTRGWLPATIERWNAERPGHGGRPRKSV